MKNNLEARFVVFFVVLRVVRADAASASSSASASAAVTVIIVANSWETKCDIVCACVWVCVCVGGGGELSFPSIQPICSICQWHVARGKGRVGGGVKTALVLGITLHLVQRPYFGFSYYSWFNRHSAIVNALKNVAKNKGRNHTRLCLLLCKYWWWLSSSSFLAAPSLSFNNSGRSCGFFLLRFLAHLCTDLFYNHSVSYRILLWHLRKSTVCQ